MSTTHFRSTPEQSNIHHLVMDIAWFGLALAATSRFLSVYAIRLGASPTQLSWLASLPAIVLLISSAFGIWWRRRYPDSVRAVFWPSLGFRFSFLLPAFAPFFPLEWQPAWLIAAIAIPAIPQGVSSTIFITMMREAVADERITALISRRSFAMNVAVALGALGFGLWLANIAFPLNYQGMFLFAFLATLVSQWHISRVKPLALPAIADPEHPAIPRRPWREAGFRRVAFATAVTHVAFFAVFPLTPLRLVSELGASESFIALFGLLELGAAALASVVMNRVLRRLGILNTIALSMGGTALGVLIVAFAPSLPPTAVAAVFMGASWTAVGIGLFAFFAENTPAGDSSRYSTAYMQVIALGMFAGPMIGNTLASTGIDLTTVLLIGAGLRLLAGMLVEFNPALPELSHRRRGRVEQV